MSVNYIVNKIFCENGNLCFQLKGNEPLLKIHARKSHDSNRFSPASGQMLCHTFSTIKIDDAYCIPLKTFFQPLDCTLQSNDIYLYAIDENEKYIQLQSSQNNTIIETNDFSITVKSTASNYAQLNLKLYFPQVNCLNIFSSQYDILLDIEPTNYSIEIGVKKRYEINSLCGNFIAFFTPNSYSAVNIPLKIFAQKSLYYSCDFYARIHLSALDLKIDVPLLYNKSSDTKVNQEWRDIKFYRNKKGGLSSYVSAIVSKKVVSLSQTKDFIKIDSIDNVLLVNDKNEIKDEYNYNNIKNICCHKEITTYTLYEQSKNTLYKLYTDKCNILYKTKDRYYIFDGNQSCLTLRIKKKFMPIKIACWASCYIRLPFQEKYNKHWRDYFEIVSDHFQLSVFSVASNPVTILKQSDLYVNDDQRSFNNIKRELDKTFFTELESSGAQYLLIDFYADALNVARKFSDGTCVGNSLSFFPKNTPDETTKYKDKIMSITTPVNSINSNYLSDWKSYCDIFCDKLKKCGYFDKVILLKGCFNTEFIDYNNKKIYDLSNKSLLNGKLVNKDYCIEKTYLWEQMNEYFISQLPDTRIIDLSSYNFYANYNFITNNGDTKLVGTHHFEDNFYRAFFAELCKQILF